MLHNIKYNYIRTASQLKEIMNVRSYCAEYYLLWDTKITQYLKLHRSTTQGILIDLRALKFLHAKTSLRARCMHARHRARNLSSPASSLLEKENS